MQQEVFFSSPSSNPVVCLVSDGTGRVGMAVVDLNPGYKVDYEQLEIEAWRNLNVSRSPLVKPVSHCGEDCVGIVANVYRYIAHIMEAEAAEDITSLLLSISKSKNPQKIENEIGFMITNISAVYDTPYVRTLPVLLTAVKDHLCSKLQ